MSSRRKFRILVMISIITLLNACGVKPTPTATALPAAIPPTATETLAPELSVNGSIVNKDTEKPMNNVRLILCRKQDETSCMIDTDLTSTTDESGQFKINILETGAYAVLYSISGEIQPDMNDKVLNYSPKSTSASPGPGNVNNLMKSLGVKSLETCNAVYEVVDGNLVVSGYVYAEALDLAFMFVSGNLYYVTVSDTAATIGLKVWDTEDKSHCDGEFNPLQ